MRAWVVLGVVAVAGLMYNACSQGLMTEEIEREYEGLTQEAHRWAEIDRIWESENLSMKLYKYFLVHSVDDHLWKPNYEKVWKIYSTKPHDHIRWNSHKEL